MDARLLSLLTASGLGCGSPSGPTQPGAWETLANAVIQVEFQPADRSRAAIWLALATTGRQTVADFFGHPIDERYVVRAYPDRPSFEAWWRSVGFAPMCWMIARATKASVEILSPRVWDAERCGHAESEAGPVITHELTHVLHARRNPLAEVNFVTELKWFNEGLAIYVAGQLTDPMRTRARALVRGPTPVSLAALGISADTYALGATIVEFLDRRYGRSALWTALSAASTSDLIAGLGTTEAELLAAVAGGG